jgi:RNA recognition motif-containing protein
MIQRQQPKKADIVDPQTQTKHIKHSPVLPLVKSIMMKEDEEPPDESPPKRQRREEPDSASAEVAAAAASSSQPVAQTDDKALSSRPEVQLQTPKLFIGGLHRSITETHIEKLMMPYGKLVRVNLVLQHDSGTSKGFAFCQYETLEQAAAAVAALDGRALLGRRLLVRPAYEKERSTGTATSFTNNTKASTASAGVSTQKERRNLDSKIQALKRKIQETNQKVPDR